ncbi:MAG: XisI protein [Pseudanabaena sp. CAN_BIN31]|nr:XisI protein [Pseudanabaena sp. CAN_BIN31]
MDTIDKSEQYRSIVKQVLTEYASYKPSYGDIEVTTVFDRESDRYLVLAIGWDNKHRVYGSSMQLDIKNGKVWIQVNNTELDIGQELIDLGVAREDIVIGFQPPYMRQFSGYAIA